MATCSPRLEWIKLLCAGNLHNRTLARYHHVLTYLTHTPRLQNLRAVYDKNGAKMVSPYERFATGCVMLMNACLKVDKEGGVAMEDAAGFFANVFGGEQFMDYVGIFHTSGSDSAP